MREVTGPASAMFRRWFNRAMIIGAISGMSLAIQMFIHGAIAGRHIRNMHWKSLQAWVSLAGAAIFLPAAITIFLIQYLVPSVAASLDSVLPCSVRPTSLTADRRRRRDSDADEDAVAEEDLAFRELAATYGGPMAHMVSWLQEPDLADNILSGSLAALWHVVMAGPCTVWVFDTGLRGMQRLVFLGIAVGVGMVLAALSVRALSSSGFWIESVSAGDQESLARKGRRAQGGSNGGTASRSGVIGAGRSALGTGRTSTLHLFRFLLVAHGLASLFFLWLHVDRGGHVHWSPFD